MSKKAAEKGRYVYMPTSWEVSEKSREICRDLRSFFHHKSNVSYQAPKQRDLGRNRAGQAEQGPPRLLIQGKRSKMPQSTSTGKAFPSQTPCALLVKSPGCYMGNQEEDIQPSISFTWFCPGVGFWFWLEVLHSFRALLSHCMDFYLRNLS